MNNYFTHYIQQNSKKNYENKNGFGYLEDQRKKEMVRKDENGKLDNKLGGLINLK